MTKAGSILRPPCSLLLDSRDPKAVYPVMREMGRVVETFVRDPETLERITKAWLTIGMRSRGTAGS